MASREQNYSQENEQEATLCHFLTRSSFRVDLFSVLDVLMLMQKGSLEVPEVYRKWAGSGRTGSGMTGSGPTGSGLIRSGPEVGW